MGGNEQEERERLRYLQLKQKAAKAESPYPPGTPKWKRMASGIGGFAVENAPFIAGETLGGAGGAALGTMIGPEGTIPGGIAGKLAGGAAGEAVGEVGRKELNTALGLRKQPNLREILDTLKGGAERGGAYSGIGQVAGPIIGKVAEKTGLKAALPKLSSLATGTKEDVFKWFSEHPRAALPEWAGGVRSLEKVGPEYKAAKAALVSSTEGAPVNPYLKALKSIGLNEAEEPIGGFYQNQGKEIGKKFIDKISVDIEGGAKIPPEKAVAANEWINSRLNVLGKTETPTAEQREERGFLMGLKDKVRKYIPEEFQKTIKSYAKAATKDQGQKVLPQGYGGRYVARRLIPLAAGLMGPAAVGGIVAGMSPLVHSTAAAAMSSGMLNAPTVKAIDVIRKWRKQHDENTDNQ
jgi:hypothetical protein